MVSSSAQYCENVALADDQHFFAVFFDFCAGVFSVQYTIAYFDFYRDGLAVVGL
jgi:hypothetical protein